MSAANGGEKNNFKIDEDEGDEVRYWYENRRYDSFSIHFLFRSYSCVGLFFPINYVVEWTKKAIRSQEEGGHSLYRPYGDVQTYIGAFCSVENW